MGGIVKGHALRDRDGYYVGYRLVFPDGQMADVVGAASRFPPPNVQFPREDVRFFGRASVIDAPSESGNFDGGFGPSAVQAHRYSQARRRGELK